MTDALTEKVAAAQFRFIVQKHKDEWVVFDREKNLAISNHGTLLDALVATKELNANAAIVAVLKELDLGPFLDDLGEYFGNRADAEYFTDNPSPHPNQEAQLLTEVERIDSLLARYEGGQK